MSLLYVSCMKFPTNRFVGNFCPILIGIKAKLLKPLKLFLSFILFYKKKKKKIENWMAATTPEDHSKGGRGHL
jgi:hypothetical protein